MNALKALGRTAEAKTKFEELLAYRNDVGLLSEIYDPRQKRFTGNFPQALSHIALLNAAFALMDHGSTQQDPKVNVPCKGADGTARVTHLILKDNEGDDRLTWSSNPA